MKGEFRTVLAALRHDAVSWWAHKTRQDHHRSMRKDVRALRDARQNHGWLSIGRYGSTLHVSRNRWIEGLHQGIEAAAELIGLPVIDSTTVPESKIVRYAVSGPMIGHPGECDPPRSKPAGNGTAYGSLDRAPIEWFVTNWAIPHGATVRNWEVAP